MQERQESDLGIKAKYTATRMLNVHAQQVEQVDQALGQSAMRVQCWCWCCFAGTGQRQSWHNRQQRGSALRKRQHYTRIVRCLLGVQVPLQVRDGMGYSTF